MSYLGDEYEDLLCRYNKEGADAKREIDRLQAENERLRAACQKLVDDFHGVGCEEWWWDSLEAARKALSSNAPDEKAPTPAKDTP